jgi:hypothetical protein
LTVFEDINYGGRALTITADVSSLRSVDFDDRISSVQIGQGETWEVCADAGYRGRCLIVTADEPDLRRRGLQDNISSVRRVQAPGRGRGPAQTPRGLQLYAGTNYSGESRTLTEAVPDFRRLLFNDRAISVRVPAGQAWEVCVSANYDDCRVVDRDQPDLAPLGISRLISSARPRPEPGRGRGVFAMRRPELTLYAEENYRGSGVVITQSTSNLGAFNERARSVRVAFGRWEVCDQIKFGGRCAVVTADVPDLRTLRMSDRVSSVRLAGEK